MERTLRQILHNPRDRDCGCSDECLCKRTTLGHALRWYIPSGSPARLPGVETVEAEPRPLRP
jgi:hypothetical protein